MKIDYDIQLLSIDLLQCVVAIVEEDGFTAAGRKLNLTQSAISMKLKRLEEMLGSRIFERTNRSIKLTSEGEVILEYAKKIMALSEEMFTTAQGNRQKGNLRFGIADHAVNKHLARIVGKFGEMYPNVKVHVETGLNAALLDKLRNGELDFAVCHREKALVKTYTLLRERLVWCCAKDFLEKEREKIPLAFLPEGCIYRDAALKALKKNNIKCEIVFTSASLSGIMAALQNSLAMSVLPLSCLETADTEFIIESDELPLLPEVELCLYGDSDVDFKKAFVRILRTMLRNAFPTSIPVGF